MSNKSIEDQDRKLTPEFQATVKKMLATPPKPHKQSAHYRSGRSRKKMKIKRFLRHRRGMRNFARSVCRRTKSTKP